MRNKQYCKIRDEAHDGARNIHGKYVDAVAFNDGLIPESLPRGTREDLQERECDIVHNVGIQENLYCPKCEVAGASWDEDTEVLQEDSCLEQENKDSPDDQQSVLKLGKVRSDAPDDAEN